MYKTYYIKNDETIPKAIDDIKKSFQDGVNKIYDKLKGLGFTPDSADLDDILDALDSFGSVIAGDGDILAWTYGAVEGRGVSCSGNVTAKGTIPKGYKKVQIKITDCKGVNIDGSLHGNGTFEIDHTKSHSWSACGTTYRPTSCGGNFSCKIIGYL